MVQILQRLRAGRPPSVQQKILTAGVFGVIRSCPYPPPAHLVRHAQVDIEESIGGPDLAVPTTMGGRLRRVKCSHVASLLSAPAMRCRAVLVRSPSERRSRFSIRSLLEQSRAHRPTPEFQLFVIHSSDDAG